MVALVIQSIDIVYRELGDGSVQVGVTCDERAFDKGLCMFCQVWRAEIGNVGDYLGVCTFLRCQRREMGWLLPEEG